MERNSDLDSRISGQGSRTPSAGNNVSPMLLQMPSFLLHGIKRRNSQPKETNCGLDPKRSSDADEIYSIDFKDLFHQLQKECERKDKQLEICSDYINVLKSSCAEKDNQIYQLNSEAGLKTRRLNTFSEQSNLTAVNDLQEECSSKDEQLVEMKSKVKQLQAEIVKQSDQLKTTRCNTRKELSEKERLIGKLQAEAVEMKKQLEKNASTISNLQTNCDEKDAQLADKDNLIKRLQTKRVKKEFELEIIPERLETLEDKVNSHYDTLFNCAEKYLQQKQYVKANEHYKEAIKFEQATQERSEKLALLFVNQSFCYGELKNYQREIDTASSALKYDPSCKEALYNRAFGYLKLKQYSHARQDLEEALRLDSDFKFAHKLLADVQSCINKAK